MIARVLRWLTQARCPHLTRYRDRDADGRLVLVCGACFHERAVGMDDQERIEKLALRFVKPGDRQPGRVLPMRRPGN